MTRTLRWRSSALMALCLVPIVIASPSLAQTDAKSQPDPRRHFMFHRPGVSAEAALADYRFCAEQARPTLSLNDKINNNKGIVGGLMSGKDRRDMRAAVMRRCMQVQGYDRYLMTREAWDAIVGDGDMAVVDDGLNEAALTRFAGLAAAPAPSSARLAP